MTRIILILLQLGLLFVGFAHAYNINEGPRATRHHLVKIIPSLSPTWFVSFELKPENTIGGWANILHFTTGGDIGHHGYRVPAVWFHSNSNRLHICSSVGTNANRCYDSPNLPKNQYSRIEIIQIQIHLKYYFIINLNGKRVFNVLNTHARYYRDVKVYQSDPWYNAAHARVRNFVHKNLNSVFRLTKNNLIQIYKQYHNQYDIAFSIKPFGKVRSWANIIHLTQGGNHGKYGDRIPAVWFYPGTNRLAICSAVSNNHNYCYSGSGNIPTNRYTHIRIVQKLESHGRYIYRIYIDGKLVRAVVNTRPNTFYNVRTYLSDPWYSQALAYVTNLKITLSNSAGFQLQRGRLIDFIPQVEQQYYLSFEVKPGPRIIHHWGSIVHLTIHGNHGKLGERIPAVWFHPRTRVLHICSALGTNVDYCYKTGNLPTNRFTHVMIRQTYDSSKNIYNYIITIDGLVKRIARNTRPTIFKSVKMWAADPWHHAADAIVRNLVFKNLPYGYSYENCQKPTPTRSCQHASSIKSYRSVDGGCNNLKHPTFGAAHTPLRRILKAEYARDGNHDTPRGFPNTDPVLPPPNLVTQQCFLTETTSPRSSTPSPSTLFMTFGQFLDHDFALSHHADCKQRCNDFKAWQSPCFPILFNNRDSQCSMNGRSFAVCSKRAYLDDRQQSNDISAFIDASNVYSNDPARFQKIRDNKDGKLKMMSNGLLPIDRNFGQHRCKIKGGCSLAGEQRVDENMALSSMHTLWAREHNRLAAGLKKINPGWNNERLFQEARKIVGAVMQHIVYTEYVPLLVKLTPYKGYNSHVDPSIINAFSHAAFRYGHSLVPNHFEQLDKGYNKKYEPILLQEAFRNRHLINIRGIEPTMFGLLKNKTRNVDDRFAFSLVRKLFIPVGHSGHLDLTALNVQRGRDHGLPGYNAYRKLCQLPTLKSWADVHRTLIAGVGAKLQRVYKHPNDIDLFIGGISERNGRGYQVGPLFQCIFKQQFEALRDGDRFFYLNHGVFTTAQLHAIKKVSMATVLCNNLKGIVSVQPKALWEATGHNIRKVCFGGAIHQLDLNAWKGAQNDCPENDMVKDEDVSNEELQDEIDEAKEQENEENDSEYEEIVADDDSENDMANASENDEMSPDISDEEFSIKAKEIEKELLSDEQRNEINN